MLAIPITSRKASVETVDEDQLAPAEKDEAIAIQNEANRIVFMRYLLKQLENNARAFDMENDGEDDDDDDPFSVKIKNIKNFEIQCTSSKITNCCS